jgi:hypothetical protein
MNGDVKKQFDELTSKMEEKTSQLKTAEELSKARLIEVEELLKIKKELSANVAKYESGDIPQDILERATLYVKVKRDYDDNRRQLLAMSTNDTTMRESTEKIRKKHFQLEKEMNMSMHKLKGTYEETVKSLMKETQSYCAYADELKVKLAAQTRQTSRILEAEKREVEMQKMIENQREELDRISKRTVGENDQDEVKQLSNEIEQLGKMMLFFNGKIFFLWESYVFFFFYIVFILALRLTDQQHLYFFFDTLDLFHNLFHNLYRQSSLNLI